MQLPVNRSLYNFLRFFQFPVAWDVSAGVILFYETPTGREYLLIRYPSGHFDYARGHLEGDETREEAALRETREETGITDIELFEKELHITFSYRAKGGEYERRKREGKGTIIFKEVFMYPGKVSTQSVELSHEHTEFVWLPYRAALLKVTFEKAKQMLRDCEAWLESHKA